MSVFNKEPFAVKDGGSIPIIAQFEKGGVKTIMGFGLIVMQFIHQMNILDYQFL